MCPAIIRFASWGLSGGALGAKTRYAIQSVIVKARRVVRFVIAKGEGMTDKLIVLELGRVRSKGTYGWQPQEFKLMKFATVALMVSLALPAVAAVNRVGGWTVTDTTSDIDGRHSFIAHVDAEGTVANVIGEPEKPLLGISCSSEGFFITIVWPDLIDKDDSGSSVTVVSKIDDKPAQRARWNAASTAVVLRGQTGVNWLAANQHSQKLTVRVPDKHGDQEAAFDLNGIAEVYAQLGTRDCR